MTAPPSATSPSHPSTPLAKRWLHSAAPGSGPPTCACATTLALVEVTLAPEVARRVADCTDPATLAALALRPDELAHHDRTVTQAIARRLHDDPAPGGSRYAGLRWWSAITGAWHTIVLFTDRAPADSVRFGAPRPLTPADPAVRHVLAALGIRVR